MLGWRMPREHCSHVAQYPVTLLSACCPLQHLQHNCLFVQLLTKRSLGLWLSSCYFGTTRKLKAALTGKLQRGLTYTTNLWKHTLSPITCAGLHQKELHRSFRNHPSHHHHLSHLGSGLFTFLPLLLEGKTLCCQNSLPCSLKASVGLLFLLQQIDCFFY